MGKKHWIEAAQQRLEESLAPVPHEVNELVATRTRTGASGFSVPFLKMGEGLPRSACRSWPQTASVLLHPKGVVVSDSRKRRH